MKILLDLNIKCNITMVKIISRILLVYYLSPQNQELLIFIEIII